MLPKIETGDQCGWIDCADKFEEEIHLDAGSKLCGECGTELTVRRTYRLCGTHFARQTESGDVTHLLLSAKEA